MFHCAFHCVTQRRARFTVRFAAFHSAARISLQPKVCRGKFPISNAIKSSAGPVNLQRVCENHPSLERKACKRLTTSLLAQHYETLLRDGLRCRCLIITSNSNSVFSSRASCQKQATSWGLPSAGTPQQNAIYVSWIALSETHFANRGFNPEFKNLRLQIIKFRFECQAIPSKKHTMRPPFWESFLDPKMGAIATPHLLLQ